MKYTSHLMTFVGGRRYRPGETFELPEGVKPSPTMTEVVEGKPAAKKEEPKLGDTKPADAQRAARAKAGGGSAEALV